VAGMTGAAEVVAPDAVDAGAGAAPRPVPSPSLCRVQAPSTYVAGMMRQACKNRFRVH
jgi:hypothetical protein